jgi:hypothetical protein
LYESGICTLELYTKIFAERADNVAIKLRKINSISGGKKRVLLDWRENGNRKRKLSNKI